MNQALLLGLAAGLGLAVAQPASAAMTLDDGSRFVGNDAVPGADPQVDGCPVCSFVINDAFGVAGFDVDTYEFFAQRAGSITPFLSTRLDDGTTATFTITAIGETINAALGYQMVNFNALQGSSITTLNTYFGFAYNAGGVVAFNYSPFSTDTGTFVASDPFFPTLGSSFTASFDTPRENSFNALDARTYSISATAIPAVPEPAAWALMILGFGIVGSALRRRRTQVRLNFA